MSFVILFSFLTMKSALAQTGSGPQAIAVQPAGIAAGLRPGQVVTIIQPNQAPAAAPAPTQPSPLPNLASALLQALSGAGANGDKGNGGASAEPPADTDWENYSYPDNYIFGYGGKGAGNVGNGLCEAKNSNRTQVKNGYCQLLRDALNKEGSCAKREMDRILQEAGSSGAGIGDLHQYCSNFSSLTDSSQRTMVFEQVLAGLITKESGWNTQAQEKPWTRADGAAMGGKGLFQIGVNDSGKDPDCAGLNSSSILDAATNIKCGSCIALKNIADTGQMGRGSTDAHTVGLAKYFGPFRDGQADKRQSIINGVNQWCVAKGGSSGSAAVADAADPGGGSSSRSPASSK